MMKKYERPEVIIEMTDISDIITVSGAPEPTTQSFTIDYNINLKDSSENYLY